MNVITVSGKISKDQPGVRGRELSYQTAHFSYTPSGLLYLFLVYNCLTTIRSVSFLSSLLIPSQKWVKEKKLNMKNCKSS